MTEFKAGDKVRTNTGIEGVIVMRGLTLCLELESFSLTVAMLRRLGIELELIEPLPEEPSMMTVFIIKDFFVARRKADNTYSINGLSKRFQFRELCEEFGTDFTILEDRDKTIRKVVRWIQQHDACTPEHLARQFGVSLDGH